jgi:hypothetical protein
MISPLKAALYISLLKEQKKAPIKGLLLSVDCLVIHA